MLSQIPSQTLETGEPCAPSFVALCFHALTNCFSRKPFVLTTIRIAPGCGAKFKNCLRFSLCAPCLRGKSIRFIRLQALCRREKSHLPWNQELPDSFSKMPGWGIHSNWFPTTFSMESQIQQTSACGAFRRVTSGRGLSFPEPLPTRGSLMLVFALQDAARAAQVLALLTSSRCRLRFERSPCGRRIS
jgi:hypothetical protein